MSKTQLEKDQTYKANLRAKGRASLQLFVSADDKATLLELCRLSRGKGLTQEQRDELKSLMVSWR